ncbi:MAG: ABC transporter permease subunit [Rhodospirillaceae bacterium]|jgi:oligopeptide transport system permease protein|nr:ABC transporter permease subunit [Rhodospirillaceae bacterium]
MFTFAIRRILGAIPTLFALITISFFIMRVAPGGPFSTNRKLTEAVLANLNKAYHLDEPLWMQFGRYLWGLAQFDFGPSMKYRDYSVTELIVQGLPVSLEVGFWAMLLATMIGIALGIAGALRRNGATDFTAGVVAMVGIAVPTFVIGPLLQTLFGLQLGWLPVAGWDGSWLAKIQPILVLALPNIAYISRLTRGSMIESLRTNYVRTARAKGIGAQRVIWKHALTGAMLPVIAYLGPATAITVTGSVVIEQIYGIPGIGRYFVEGASNRDYPLVMGVTILYGGIVILANIVTDVLRGVIDPKVSYE